MPQGSQRASLWDALSGPVGLTNNALCGAEASVRLSDLVRGSALGCRAEDLRGRTVLIATTDQLSAALALIELDGVAGVWFFALPIWPSNIIRTSCSWQRSTQSSPIGWRRSFPRFKTSSLVMRPRAGKSGSARNPTD